MTSNEEAKVAPEEQAAAKAPSDTGANQKDETELSCEVLCALSNNSPPPGEACPEQVPCAKKGKKSKGCGKQHQLPMFLSKTFHLVDRADPSICTWSETGDSFVVKNVEQFSSTILPQYFKHSNFSSFARQLNFYGFRKLKAEPILTADYDAKTACYVRFYHEKFQKDKPELLRDIKRATKSDMTSKDDVEGLKQEISKLKEHVSKLTSDYDRKLAEMSYEYNRRITALHADHDRLGLVVQQLLAKHGENIIVPPSSASSLPFPPVGLAPDMMQSLTQAASSLQNGTIPPAASSTAPVAAGTKRPATTEAPAEAAPPPASKAKAV